MNKYKMKTPKKVEETVVGTYKKVEDAVVYAYKKIEAGAVSGYQKMEGKFIEKFLEPVETTPKEQEEQ